MDVRQQCGPHARRIQLAAKRITDRGRHTRRLATSVAGGEVQTYAVEQDAQVHIACWIHSPGGKPMTEVESPALLRRQLGRFLREAREGCGLTIAIAAKEVQLSFNGLQRLESAFTVSTPA
ncbi:helix-turn-helix domain-containing protein [Nocardia gamkensis]|uniref:helix-turn-helix domain-containing protein n=1 Tax=Nocardia gamkensis TaxID=352869 RepID=UPI0037C5EC04